MGEKDLFERIEELTSAQVPLPEMEEVLWREYGVTRAVMVIDSKGFARTTRDAGIVSFLQSLMKCRQVVASAPLGNKILHSRCETDNFFIECENVDDAFEAARALREAVANARIPLVNGEYYSIIIGIGFGRMLHTRDEGLYGQQMNLASKLGEDIGKPGQILLTDEAFAALDNRFKGPKKEGSVCISGVEISYHVF